MLPLLLFHTRAVLSQDAVAILLPSGDHATDATSLLCPVSVSSVLPLLLLHTRAVLSSDAVAILLPSGDHATDVTSLMCPVSVRILLTVIAMNPDETPSDPNTSDDVCTYTMPGSL